ncbi:MAG: uncharacterized protein KVP18_004618 [Porospora cf. gigantea A]|nr:MAG: hypothetical protein KVP18_004618 [Porospora cf. gigantea A]
MRGTKAGQHAMFQRGDIAVVYIWNQNTWEFVGEVVTGQEDSAIIGHSGQTYEGDDTFPPGIYDFVFQVEIRDGAPLAPLPYRRTENPLTVAERFCLRENLSRANIQQIVEFIKNNADLPEPSALREPQRAEPVSVHFPIAEIVTFKSTKNVHVAFEKLAEFAAEHGDDAWTDLELEYLETMRRSITDSGRRLRMVEIELMKAMKPLRWPHNQRLPFLDVWRMFLLHPSSTALFKGPDDGWKYTAVFVGIARDTAYPIAARQMALRVLSNLAASPTSRRALCFKFSYIARDLLGLPSEMMPTLGALLLNYAVSVPQFSAEVDAAAVISLLREVAAHGPSEYLALTTLGTLLCASKAARSGDCAWARSTKAEGREAECASDVQAFLDHF